MARATAGRSRKTRPLLAFGALCGVLVYLLWANLDSASLGGTGWSNRSVRHLRLWDGHRKLHLLVILSRHCGQRLEPEAENRCLASVSKVCPGFSSRSCIWKQGVAQSEPCDRTQDHSRGSNDVKDM